MNPCYISWYSKHIKDGKWRVFTHKEFDKYANEILAVVLPLIEHTTPGTPVGTIEVVQDKAFLVKVGNEEHGGIVIEITPDWENELRALISQLLNKSTGSLGICIRPRYKRFLTGDKPSLGVFENILKGNPRIRWICVLQGGTEEFPSGFVIFMARGAEYTRLSAKLRKCSDINVIKV